jgi:hypothetical protein
MSCALPSIETLRLKIQRGASDIREVSMVAVHKPPEQQ